MTEVIVKDRDVFGGVAVFRGTRVPLQTLLDDFPTVSREAAIAALKKPSRRSSGN